MASTLAFQRSSCARRPRVPISVCGRPDCASEAGRACAGIRGQLTLRRGNRLGDPLERRGVRIDKRRAVARTGRRSSAAFAEEALHDSVLKTVEGNDCEPSAGLQRSLGRFEAFL